MRIQGWDVRRTEREAFHPLGVGLLGVASNGLVISGSIGAREQLDVSSVHANDRAGLGAFDTPASSLLVVGGEAEVLGTVVVADVDVVRGSGKRAGTESRQQDKFCALLSTLEKSRGRTKKLLKVRRHYVGNWRQRSVLDE